MVVGSISREFYMAQSLAKVKQQIVTCTRCPLHEQCTSPVPMTVPNSHIRQESAVTRLRTPGTMNVARINSRRALADNQFIVVGEAPGRIEDHTGKPFVGPAGALLRTRLADAGLHEANAYWLNVVCCYPHGTPDSTHIAACRANLQAQWEAAPPKYVLVCGTTALKALVSHTQPKYCRGVAFGLLGKVVFPTYHPAAFAPGRNSVDPSKWHRDLELFGMIVRGEVEPHVDKCIYCDRDRVAYAPTCFTHVSKYRLDNQWNLPKQGSLL